jgi:hypothetical protein
MTDLPCLHSRTWFLCGEPADRVDDRQPGAGRALGVVLMRLGIAEINQHAVAIYLATKPLKRATVSATQRW